MKRFQIVLTFIVMLALTALFAASAVAYSEEGRAYRLYPSLNGLIGVDEKAKIDAMDEDQAKTMRAMVSLMGEE